MVGGSVWAVSACLCMLLIHASGFVTLRREWLLIACVSGMGCSIDSLLFYSGVLLNDDGSMLMPLWLACVWVMFSMTLCHLFSWLHNRLLLAACLGAVSGPLSYLGGSHWAPVSFAEPLWLSLAVMSCIWLLLFPSVLYVARRIYVERTT